MFSTYSQQLFKKGSFSLLFILWASAMLGQTRDFTPFIEELKNGFKIDEGEIIQEDDEISFISSSIELDSEDYVFYIYSKSDEITALAAAFETTTVSESEILKDIQASTSVVLENIENDVDILSYFVKDANQIVGVIEFATVDGVKIVQFYQVPGSDIQESVAQMASIIEPDNIDNYKGKQTDEELPIFASSYQAKGATSSYFVDKLGATYLYTEFTKIKPYVLLALFGKDLQPFKKEGFTEISLKKENIDGVTITRYFTAKRNGFSYIIEVWNNHAYGMTAHQEKIDLTDDFNEEKVTEKFPAPATFPPHSGVYNGDDLADLIGRHLEDPAVQGFLKHTNSIETYNSGNFLSFEGDDITIDLFEKRVKSIFPGKSYMWPYNTPKDHVKNISQSSLPYEETYKPYVSAIKNGVEYMLYFDEETKEITMLRIQEE